MRREDAGTSFAKRQRQAMKQLIRAVPNVFVRAHAEIGLEVIIKSLPNETVNAVRGHQQITIRL